MDVIGNTAIAEKDIRAHIRSYVVDSLLARSGRILTAETINNIALELVERMLDLYDVDKKRHPAP